MLPSKKRREKEKKSTGAGPSGGIPPTPCYVLNLHGHLHPGFPLLASGSMSFLSVPTITPSTRARLHSARPSHLNTRALQFHSGPTWPVPRTGPGWQKWASGSGRHPDLGRKEGRNSRGPKVQFCMLSLFHNLGQVTTLQKREERRFKKINEDS